MTKEEYEDFVLRYKGCGACFPMYHTLSRFEKMWFSAIQKDVADIEKENATLKEDYECLEDAHNVLNELYEKLEKENAELRKVAEFQQSSNMSRHFENKKLKEVLAVGSMWNKHLNSQNKALEEDRDKYRNMVFNKDEQLTNAKKIIKKLVDGIRVISDPKVELTDVDSFVAEAENFLKDSEVEK